MTLTTYLVDILSIKCNVERSLFSELELEKLANLILQVQGIIQPLIVKKTGLDEYELIEGTFEYYAAVKAHEIDDYFEMIRVFIISDEEHDVIQKQLNFFRPKITDNNQIVNTKTNFNDSDIGLNNLEKRLNEINVNLQPLKDIKEMVEMVLNLQQQLQQNQVESQPKIKEIKKADEEKLEPLNAFNTLPIHQLVLALKRAEITQKEAEKIVESVKKEREKKPFASLNDVVNRVKKTRGKDEIKAISSEKMINIIDTWSKTSL